MGFSGQFGGVGVQKALTANKKAEQKSSPAFQETFESSDKNTPPEK
jgi:hypothetical protein